MDKEIKYDKRNTPEIQELMNSWRIESNLLPKDTFKYIIRKEYKSTDDTYYIEIITNRPGYLIGVQGERIKKYVAKFNELNISRVDVLDTYKIHTVYHQDEDSKGE